MTVDNITAASVLYAAIDYCDEHGWVHGTEGKDGGPRCMIGAVDSVRLHQNGFIASQIDAKVSEVNDGKGIVGTNDHTPGGWEAVKARFVEIAEKLRGNGG